MFGKVENSEIENAVIEKMLAFKQALTMQPTSNKLYHRFLSDVLKDILNEVSHATPLFFPLWEWEKIDYEHILYQQYDLFFLKDSDAIEAETIQKLFPENNKTLPNANGIVLHQNNLYHIQFDNERKVTNIQPINYNFDARACDDLRLSILDKTQSKLFSTETHLIADEPQRALISHILQIANVKQMRSNESIVVIRLIVEIEAQIEHNFNKNRQMSRIALKEAWGFTFLATTGLLLADGRHLFLLYALGKTISIAKLLMLTYISGGILVFLLAIPLSFMLYDYINNRQCEIQITKLRALVNQSKVYALDDNTEAPNPESFNYEATTAAGENLKNEFFINEKDPTMGRIRIQYPSFRTLFFHHKPEFQNIDAALRLAPSPL